MRCAGIVAGLIVALGLSCVTAQAEELSRLEMVQTQTQNSDTVEILLKADGIQKAAMLQFAVQYDENSLECVSAVQGDVFQNNLAPTINAKIPGHVYFAWDSLNEIGENGTVMALRFRRITQDETAVTFDFSEEFLAVDSEFQSIDVNAEGVTVAQTAEQPAQTETEAPTQDEQRTGSNQGLTMSDSRLDMKVGQSKTLRVSEKTETLYWESSNEAVASVENGKVTVLAPGEAVITAMTEDGVRYASCYISGTEQKNAASAQGVILLPIGGLMIAALGMWYFKKKKVDNRFSEETESGGCKL